MSDNNCMLAPAQMLKVEEHKYPLILQPKLDGVRCLLIKRKPHSRNMKGIRNRAISKLFATLPTWLDEYVLDGELYAHGQNFNQIQSIVMDEDDALPEAYRYVVWDIMTAEEWHKRSCARPYALRYNAVLDVLQNRLKHRFVQPIEAHRVDDPKTFEKVYAKMLTEGYEGGMVKRAQGRYKWGRCTVNEATLLKHKPVFDVDLKITGVEEGTGKRAKAVGALVCMYEGKEVRFGPGEGVTEDQLAQMWRKHPRLVNLIGKVMEGYHSGITADGSLRFPKWRAIRGVTRFDR